MAETDYDYATALQRIAEWQPGDILSFENLRISSLPPLPSNVKELNIGWSDITELPTIWPESLELLNIEALKIVEIKTLPPKLKILKAFSTKCKTIASLPETVTELDLSCSHISALPPLPTGLQSLDIQCSYLTALPPLPKSLKTLRMKQNVFGELKSLPGDLRDLQIYSSDIEVLPPLPKQLRTLVITNSKKVVALPELPDTLEHLEISMTKISTLPPKLPTNLTYLDISYTPITQLPPLPIGLVRLIINKTDIHTLPVLPNNLLLMDISRTRVQSLPEPFHCLLGVLSAIGVHLKTLPEFPETLNNSENFWCNSYYFPGFNATDFQTPCKYSLAVRRFRAFTNSLPSALELYLSRKRSIHRCKAVKEDLMAATWHTDRVLDWCDPKAFEYED